MDDAIPLLVELLSAQVPQAPGSPETTRRALAALGPLPETPQIADLGCGRGQSALVLAEETGGRVLALDLLPQMVQATRQRAAAAGLADRVQAVVGDMGAPPVAPGSLDLLWSEGAAYSIGFDHALGAWRPLLRDGGGIGVSELCWRDADPPAAARDWLTGEYPDVRHGDVVTAAFQAAGYALVERFWQPASDWRAYYGPLRAHLPAFRARHAGDATALQVADMMQAEADAWARWGDHYGYLFLVGRREAA